MSRDSSVSTGIICGVDERDFIPGKGKNLPIRHRIRTSLYVHPSSHYVVTGDPSPDDKAARSWASHTLTSID
jgi:hypothetical protein